jgi:ribosomal protein S18 acetylase RimI-like enzyme
MKILNSKFTVSQARIQDLPSIVKIHNEVLKSGIYSLLGLNFLERYYRASILNKNIVFIAKSQNKILGIIELDFHLHSSNILNLCDLLNLLLILLKDPRYIYVILFRLAKKDSSNTMIEISNFAVMKSFRSLGVGKKLLDATVKYAAEKKLNLYTFTHNKRLVNFYLKKMGGELISSSNLFIYMSYYVKIKIVY